MRRNYLSMAIVFSLQLLLCIIMVLIEPVIPFYLAYVGTLPLAVALAGVVDMILGLTVKSMVCRLLSLVSGALSVLVVLFAFGIDLGLRNAIYRLVPLFCVMIAACWVARGIISCRKHSKGT